MYRALGYRLASWGYLGVTVGTSLGLSIGLAPIPDAKRSEEIDTKDLDTLQAVIIGLSLHVCARECTLHADVFARTR